MEHAAQPQLSPKTDQLFKVFIIILLADGVLKLLDVLITYHSPVFDQIRVVPATVANLLSIVGLIMAITLWIRSKKRNYPKFMLWVSIVRVFIPLFLGVLAGAFMFSLLFQAVIQTSHNSNQQLADQIQMAFTNSSPWLVAIPALNGLLFIGLGVYSLLKFRKL